jgi:hypothetical protein
MKYNPGVGPTDELSLRVSVATLVRVVFKLPTNSEWMLVLERKATLQKDKVEVKSQPFGGAIRILDLDTIHALIGDFHFDSDRSRSEQDFRLFINPTAWKVVQEFCIQHFNRVDDPILETDPGRELAEEFADALGINLKPEHYLQKPIATIVENDPAPTENIHAKGMHTVRVYRIFEAHIVDTSLIDNLISNSERLSHQDLCELALKDAQHNGKGRANAILALPLKQITDHYLSMSLEKRNMPALFKNNRLEETVSLVFDDITVPKYQRL